MEKTIMNTRGVIGVLNEARVYNSSIGEYKEHFINERFGYTVRLTNGRIEMSKEIAADYEVQPNSVSKDRIGRVVQTFINQ
jgi:hypothetical protein